MTDADTALIAELREEADCIEHGAWPQKWRDLMLRAATSLEAAHRERDEAIAHDRQPYPTAWAYERVCEARTKWQVRAGASEASVIADVVSHWFIQGGKATFGELREAHNPDELVSAILSVVRAQLRAVEQERDALKAEIEWLSQTEDL